MKKIIILLLVCLSSCNSNDINIVGHKKLNKKDKLPDLVIEVLRHVEVNDGVELFFHVENLGGSNFSNDSVAITIHIEVLDVVGSNENDIREVFYLNNITNGCNFFFSYKVFTEEQCLFIHAIIDEPTFINNRGTILESNEDNNKSNTIKCIVLVNIYNLLFLDELQE